LANGYHELLDPEELVARNNKINQQRVLDGNPPLPTESRLLAAMRSGMPACAGVALGVDRLLMLALQGKSALRENSIESVIAFPFDRASLASGIDRMPLDLAPPFQNLPQRPTLARSAHGGTELVMQPDQDPNMILIQQAALQQSRSLRR